jgi:hypothetical protein
MVTLVGKAPDKIDDLGQMLSRNIFSRFEFPADTLDHLEHQEDTLMFVLEDIGWFHDAPP